MSTMFPPTTESNSDWRNARQFRLSTNFGVNAYYLGAFAEPELWQDEEGNLEEEFDALMRCVVHPSRRTKSRFENFFKEQQRKRALAAAVSAAQQATRRTSAKQKRDEPRTSARGIADIEW